MESVDQVRLREHYAGMTEDEIGALAAQAYNLTEIGREALAAVIAEKGFKIQLREAPAPEEPRGAGDSKDQLDLKSICQVKSEADARRAKGILHANSIASCLGPDDIADLENFKGSFDGGVDVKVFSEDSSRAGWVLREYAPDLMKRDDDHILEDEEQLDYAVTCPKCQSEDIVLDETEAQPGHGKFPEKFRWTCAACGHQWQDEGILHIVNNKARGHSSSSD
jgi:DNA-directed RNA polymerase subunit M/transcription elongation factor TFIIS